MLDKLSQIKANHNTYNSKKILKNTGGVNPNLEQIKRNTIFALLSLVSAIGINGMNINSASASQINSQNLPQNLQTLQNSTNSNLVAQNNEPKWVIVGRQNIMKFVEENKGVLENFAGDESTDLGQFARLVIEPNSNVQQTQNEIQNTIKNLAAKLNEGETRLILISYPNGKIGGYVIRRFSQDMRNGKDKVEAIPFYIAFPGFRGDNFFRPN